CPSTATSRTPTSRGPTTPSSTRSTGGRPTPSSSSSAGGSGRAPRPKTVSKTTAGATAAAAPKSEGFLFSCSFMSLVVSNGVLILFLLVDTATKTAAEWKERVSQLKNEAEVANQ